MPDDTNYAQVVDETSCHLPRLAWAGQIILRPKLNRAGQVVCFGSLLDGQFRALTHRDTDDGLLPRQRSGKTNLCVHSLAFLALTASIVQPRRLFDFTF